MTGPERVATRSAGARKTVGMVSMALAMAMVMAIITEMVMTMITEIVMAMITEMVAEMIPEMVMAMVTDMVVATVMAATMVAGSTRTCAMNAARSRSARVPGTATGRRVPGPPRATTARAHRRAGPRRDQGATLTLVKRAATVRRARIIPAADGPRDRLTPTPRRTPLRVTLTPRPPRRRRSGITMTRTRIRSRSRARRRRCPLGRSCRSCGRG